MARQDPGHESPGADRNSQHPRHAEASATAMERPPAMEIEHVDAWRGNLLSAVEDSLNTVLLARSESALVELLTQANSDIGVTYVNACVFTEISCTLASYTFTRPARTMLQSFLSSFPLPELLNDARSAVDELGCHLMENSEP
ncbi:unnamed protein product [Schistocephalus solidus]|uniref:DUF727 domain-containing protein n=1 Tax=Schistocephalus solidus TaxID=70667 RepID=A0A183SQU6_SCHSO|nr:unnamed protein product [Schistocephalus solidus]